MDTKNCSNTTIFEFMEAIYECKYEAFGNAEKFTSVHSEYLTLINDDNSKVYKQLFSTYIIELSKYTALLAAYQILSRQNSEEILANLAKLGYAIKDNTEKSLRKLEIWIKNIEISVKKSEVEIQNYLEKSNKSSDTKSDFIQFIAVLSKYMGFKIDMQTTLIEFAGYYNLFKQHGNR